MPKVVNDVKCYLESPKLEYVSNLPFDAVHTMSEFMITIKNVKRSKQFAGGNDGSLERIPRQASEHRGKAAEIEDALLPVPLLFVAANVICSRSKLTAQYFNLMMLSYARQPILLSPEKNPGLGQAPVCATAFWIHRAEERLRGCCCLSHSRYTASCVEEIIRLLVQQKLLLRSRGRRRSNSLRRGVDCVSFDCC